LKKRIRKLNLNPPQMIAISFLVIITFGTCILLLPWATRGESLNVVDALFTAVSAVCVTGLTVVDISQNFTPFGQIVVLTLIQMGGLGIMTFSTFFLYLLGRRISIRGREVIDSTFMTTPVQNIGSLLRRIMMLVFVIEGVGVVLLTLSWMRYFPFPQALYHGFFHAISAFCNAGFSLFSTSFEQFQLDPFINFVSMALIILGGLGFVVLIDFKNRWSRSSGPIRRLSFHTKVVCSVAFFLIFISAFFLFYVERIHSLSAYAPNSGFLIALFQSVTARTAGFNTISISRLSNGGCFILMFLMFIGAAPGSCGGGVKVSTLGILVAMFISRLRGQDESHIFYHTIPRETISKALTIVISAVILIAVIFMGLLFSENWNTPVEQSRGHFVELLFETISAFGTVGLSMGVTPTLSTIGRILITILMFVGRLGPLTMAVVLTRPVSRGKFRYARGEVMIG